MASRILRRAGWLAAILVAVTLAGLATAWLVLRASLPALAGTRAIDGLVAPVALVRDDHGLLSVHARSPDDLARGLGYAHAQERYFEMDLARRAAAGELAALLGPALLPLDRRHRLHRFRARARDHLAALPADAGQWLQAYVDGVNAGLGDLSTRPWPYLLLRQQPQAWQAEDSLLVVLAMFFDLQDGENRRERQLDRARRHLHPAAYDFIVRGGGPLDAPLTGGAWPLPPLPTPEQLDLRRWPPVPADEPAAGAAQPELPGSNSFAVAGRLRGGGAALVANDMHLGLRVPNLWFRARLVVDGAPGGPVQGVTLPGAPGVVVGSSERIAWAFTNSYGDWMDLVRIAVDPADPGRYLDAAGSHAFDEHVERIAVAGAADEVLAVRETRWGPLVGEDADGYPLALAWTAHRRGAVDVALLDLARADDIDAALAIATRAGIPAQNFIVGDADGRIAWTIAGRIPRRLPGRDGRQAIDSAALTGDVWAGWLAPDEYPVVRDPPSGRLWTANARVVGGEELALLGDGGYDLGARAGQIRDGLFAREQFDAEDLLAIQLDDRALLLERWWHLLRATLAGSGDDAGLAALAAATATWEGCACPDAVAYRLTRAFRTYVHEAVMRGLSAPVRAQVDDFTWPRLGQNEQVVWQLVTARPSHLLPPPHADWDALLRAQAQRVVAALGDRPGGLAARSWGEANTVRLRHPVSAALPAWLARALDMTPRALPGDGNLPRVQGVRFGASQRLVAAPGEAVDAILHMPGGQSGHPLSPYYGAGQDDWERGRASPLEPGAPRWTLTLQPR